MDIKIKTVESKSDLKKFIKCQWDFYAGDKNFVPPIIADRMKLLNEEKNPFFQHSDIKHFLAYDKDEIVGRISAIENRRHNELHNDKIGFFGFFECINNQKTANALFYAAENWLKGKGLEHSRGPVNPSMNDEIGLLTEGFDSPPVALMTYNPPYYADLIEKAGYTKEKDLYAYKLYYENYVTDKLVRAQDLIRKRYDVTVRSVNFKDKEQFKEDVETLREIYNKAWEPNWGFVKMTDEEFDFLAADLKQIAAPELTLILEVKGKPAGFVLGLPDINQVLINNRKGGLPGAAWQLLTKKKKINTMRIIVLGLLKEYQNIGLDAVLYYEVAERGKTIGIDRGEASWVLEDNEKMNRALRQIIKGDLYKKYRIYQKEL